ncbi:MAG: hypothetical protein R6U39_00300 [Candidatus Aegiribacteria sp.]
MKRLACTILVTLLFAAACSNEVVAPGNEIRGSLPEKTHTLAEAWPQAGDALPALGRPMQLDVYTEVHDISGSGIMVIDVRSHDFDPVAAVVDGSGSLTAFSDNWKDSPNARIVLEGAPSGGRLLVFSPDDSRGLYDVVIREGTENDLAAFTGTMDLSAGSITGWIRAGGYNPVLESVLRDALEDHIYIYNYSQAELYPFSLENDDLVSLSLTSDSFDPYLVLMSVEGGEYRFVDYNDDYGGSDSRIVRELEAGDYIVAAMPYSAGGEGRFSIELESLDMESMEAVGTPAVMADVEYTGEIAADRNLAMAWWPAMMDDWEVPDFLDPFTPVAAFTFAIDEPGVYRLDASGGMDVCLTLLREGPDRMTFVASNDDFMGTDSRIVEPLMPGDYVALVSPYSGTLQGDVTFIRTNEDADVQRLGTGRSVEEFAPYDMQSLMYQLSVTQGGSYTVSVESDDLDPVMTLHLPDGEVLYDDDGGEGTNSQLDFTAGQTGDCFLKVEKYSDGEGTFLIRFDRN